MKNIFKQSLYTIITLTCTLTLVVPPAMASHAWGNYHWARTTPSFTLQLKNSMTSQWQPSLAGAVADWNVSAVLDFASQTSKRKRNCAGTDGMVETCNAAYGNNGWLGIAQIWVSGDHITKGIVKLNDTYYSTSSYNTPAWRNLVVCQEIGHTLGLGHNDEDFSTTNGTCMDYSNDPIPNQHPDAHDYDMLVSIYTHLDSFNSYAAAGTGGGKGKPSRVGQEIDLSSVQDWGEVVKTDALNNPSLYKRSLSNGEIVFTHVTWVPDFENYAK